MRDLRTFTVEGPVQVEIMVLTLDRERVHLTGPCGPEPWYVEVAQDADPMDVATRLTSANVGEPVLCTPRRGVRRAVVLF